MDYFAGKLSRQEFLASFNEPPSSSIPSGTSVTSA